MATPVENPPPPGRRIKPSKAGVWIERLKPVREQPGVWFQLDGDWSQAVAGQIRAGTMLGVERHEFETQQRKRPNGRYHVYVRYVGKPKRGPDDWTVERVAQKGLPKRFNERGDMEVLLPESAELGPRWVEVSQLPRR